MLQFIFGKSGTGKTFLCNQQITAELQSNRGEFNLIYLVPEQATYQAEKAVLSAGSIKGFSRLYILSFQRLCYSIFGKNIAVRPLNTACKNMLVSRLLAENADRLQIFASTANRTGTAAKLAGCLGEFQQYSKTPDDIDRFITEAKIPAITSAKLSDINLIYRQYIDFVEKNFYNVDNQLNLAANSVKDSPLLKGAKVWVDGFSGFTTAEFNLLGEILKISSQVKIALCLDYAQLSSSPDAPDTASIFYPTIKTFYQIRSLSLPQQSPVVLDTAVRFRNSEPLKHLEKNIFSLDEPKKISAAGDIKLTACAKTRTEVDYVGRQICSLVRSEGLRYKDIAVIASDLQSYRHYIQAVFTDLNIPFFIDSRRSLSQYPAVELINCALQIACRKFSTADIISCLKTDLAGISRTDTDLLENYCLAYNISFADWLSEDAWNFAVSSSGFDDAKINAIRQKAMEHLFSLRAVFQNQDMLGVSEFCDAILNFLESLKVSEKICSWAQAGLKKGSLDEAQMHRQFISQFSSTLDDMRYVFRNSQFSSEQLSVILNASLAQMTVALIPPAQDQVLIGSIERSRHPDIKAVFLLGTTASQFPSSVSQDSILTDTDRLAAESSGFDLAKSSTAQLLERRYLAYIAFTRPQKYLYITYPLANEKGQDIQRSFFIDSVQSLFSDLNEQKYFGTERSFDSVFTLSDLKKTIARTLACDCDCDNDFARRCKYLLDDGLSDKLADVKSAVEYNNTAKLDDGVAFKIFDKTLKASASRLRTFASCPYQHFAKYILSLQERNIFEFASPDIGKFYHAVIEQLFYELKQQSLSLTTADDRQISAGIDTAVEKVILNDSFLKNFKNHSLHNSYILVSAAETVRAAVSDFASIAKAGRFTQIAAELDFDSGKPLEPIEIEIASGRKIIIAGKIDRVDAVSVGSENYAVVFDYKTPKTKVNYAKLAAGIDLQLLIYLLAVDGKAIGEIKNIKPLGAFYLPVNVPKDTLTHQQLAEACKQSSRKAAGLFNGEFFKLLDCHTDTGYSRYYNYRITQTDQYGNYNTSSLLKPCDFEKIKIFAKEKIKELAEGLFDGKIDVNPYRQANKSACSFCAYKAVCRFDWQLNRYRDIEQTDKTQFIGSIEK